MSNSNPLFAVNASTVVPCLALRPREAAEALGVSERTLWAWTKNGRIPHVRMGGAVLYPVESLRLWLREQACGTPDAASDQTTKGNRGGVQ